MTEIKRIHRKMRRVFRLLLVSEISLFLLGLWFIATEGANPMVSLIGVIICVQALVGIRGLRRELNRLID